MLWGEGESMKDVFFNRGLLWRKFDVKLFGEYVV